MIIIINWKYLNRKMYKMILINWNNAIVCVANVNFPEFHKIYHLSNNVSEII